MRLKGRPEQASLPQESCRGSRGLGLVNFEPTPRLAAGRDVALLPNAGRSWVIRRDECLRAERELAGRRVVVGSARR